MVGKILGNPAILLHNHMIPPALNFLDLYCIFQNRIFCDFKMEYHVDFFPLFFYIVNGNCRIHISSFSNNHHVVLLEYFLIEFMQQFMNARTVCTHRPVNYITMDSDRRCRQIRGIRKSLRFYQTVHCIHTEAIYSHI